MTKRHMKYNPSFLSEAQLIENFVVRHADLDLIIRIISENNTGSNQHVLVIGPRGSGKTTLIHRIAAEIKQNADLNDRWYPLIFSEESYEVVSVGEFWLEALFHLAEQMKDEKLKSTYLELKAETDDKRLAERALGQLLDFADNKKKRILLCVENLNMLLGDLVNTDEAWKIRHTLINEPRLMLLATATSRFEHIENSSQAMFEMFKLQELKMLDDDECNRIWELVTGEMLQGERIKPIRILTGGNPRLLTIIAKFGAHRSFRKLLDDLVDLIDDHTDYFKSHLDNLPAIERKVYLALAGLWDASTARDIANAARLDTNKTSSLLNRLIGRGAVIVEEQRKKIKWYAVSERMYNIYYLMRRRGKPSDRVKATVKFMVSMYDPENAAKLITEEACKLSPEVCFDHYLAYEETIKEAASPQLFEKILAATPKSFLDSPHISETLKNIIANQKLTTNEKYNDSELFEIKEAINQIHKGIELKDWKATEYAIEKFNQVIERINDIEDKKIPEKVAMVMAIKAVTLWKLNRTEEAVTVCDEIINQFLDTEKREVYEMVAMIMAIKAVTLRQLERFDEAIAISDEVIKRFMDTEEKKIREQVVIVMLNKAFALEQLNRTEEVIEAYDGIIERFLHLEETEIREQVVIAMLNKSGALRQLNRTEEAIAVYENVVAQFANAEEDNIREQVATAMVNKAVVLGQLDRLDEAIEAYDSFIERFADVEETGIREQVVMAMFSKGYCLVKLNRYDEVIMVYEEMVEHFTNAEKAENREFVAMAMVAKGYCLEKLNRLDEAIEAYDSFIERFSDIEESEIREHVAMAFCLKSTIFVLQNKYEEAENALRKAIVLKPDFTLATIELIDVLLKRPEKLDIAMQTAEEAIGKKPDDSALLNDIAWAFYKHDNLSLLPIVEKWARQAVLLSTENANAHRALACILSALGKGSEALPSARRYIQDSSLVENSIEDAIELFVELAASGNAKEALDILVNSPVQQHLEPLVIGLKYYIGEDVKTAAEIQEVASDIVKRIEERAKRRGHHT